jgi:hypothetical protein
MLARLRSSFIGGTLGIGVTALLCMGCSTTTSTEMRKNPSYAAGPVSNVLVLGGRMNEETRQIVEADFVDALARRGVRATASYVLFAGALPSQEDVKQAIESGGYDAMLVARMRGVSERDIVEPGAAYEGPFWGGGNAANSYWGTSAQGYVESETIVRFETTLWHARSGEMIWSDVTQTKNPSSAPEFIQSLLSSVMPAMEKARLLPHTGAAVSYVSQ